MENSDESSSSEVFDFLNQVLSLLEEGKVFTTHDDSEKSILDFKHPAELEKIFSSSLDEQCCVIEDNEKLVDICRQVIKYSLKTSNRNFHNQLFGGVDHVGVGAEWITTALNTSQYTFEVAPIFTLIEKEIIKKCLQLFGFSSGDGVFCAGGSLSNMYGIHSARFSKYPNSKTEGNPAGLVLFTSNLCHYSVGKGANFLGIGTNNVIYVQTNNKGQMCIDDLEQKIIETISRNLKPFMVNATCGTTVLGSFDDLKRIAEVCRKYELWMHVDACLGGSAIFSSSHRHLLDGIHLADSLSWNPHKSLGVPLQCSIFLVKHEILYECNSCSADYLFQQDKFYDNSYDTGDKSLSCGRKIDSFKFWLIWKKRGVTGFEVLMENAFSMSEYLHTQISKRKDFHLILDDIEYTNVCFYFFRNAANDNHKEPVKAEKCWHCISQLTLCIKEQLTMNGNLMISYNPLTQMNIGYFFRMVVTAHPKATKESMEFVLNEIENIGKSIPLSSYLCTMHANL